MNYQELVAAAKAFADRNDVEVSDNIDTFIILVEAKINRLLKTREQTARVYTPTVTDSEYYGLPVDFAGMRDIQLNSALPTVGHKVTRCEYATPEQMNVKKGQPFCGVLYYTVIGSQIQVYPTQEAGGSLEIVYYQKVPNLNNVDSENWLSISHPDIYVSGITAEIEIFAKNYDAGKLWYDRMSIAVDEIKGSNETETWSGSSLVMKVC